MHSTKDRGVDACSYELNFAKEEKRSRATTVLRTTSKDHRASFTDDDVKEKGGDPIMRDITAD